MNIGRFWSNWFFKFIYFYNLMLSYIIGPIINLMTLFTDNYFKFVRIAKLF